MKKKILIGFILFVLSFCLFGCGKKVITVKPNETAFAIPYEDTEGQTVFNSEKYLAEKKVAAKRVVINYIWQGPEIGNQPDLLVLKVDRAPITREWTEDSTGSTKKNQGITAESKESIAFMARFNCTTTIEEKNAVTYLYRYPSNLKLSKVMDDEVRAVIEGKFTEACSKRTIAEIILNKAQILKEVKDHADSYFKERGITISVLGYKGEFTYLDKGIQESINEKFKEDNKLIAQQTQNDRLALKAEAERLALEKNPQTLNYELELKKTQNQADAIKKWDGKAPLYMGGEGSIFNIPIK
jgi:hypothetical protein